MISASGPAYYRAPLSRREFQRPSISGAAFSFLPFFLLVLSIFLYFFLSLSSPSVLCGFAQPRHIRHWKRNPGSKIPSPYIRSRVLLRFFPIIGKSPFRECDKSSLFPHKQPTKRQRPGAYGARVEQHNSFFQAFVTAKNESFADHSSILAGFVPNGIAAKSQRHATMWGLIHRFSERPSVRTSPREEPMKAQFWALNCRAINRRAAGLGGTSFWGPP